MLDFEEAVGRDDDWTTPCKVDTEAREEGAAAWMDVLAGLLVARAVAAEAEVIQAVLLVAGGSEGNEMELDSGADEMESVAAGWLLSIANVPVPFICRAGEVDDAAELALRGDSAEEFTVRFESTTASALRFMGESRILPRLRRFLASFPTVDRGKAVALAFVIAPRWADPVLRASK